MEHTQCKQRGQCSCQNFAIGAVDLGQRGEDKGQGHVLGKIGVRARRDLQVIVLVALVRDNGFAAGRVTILLGRVVPNPVLVAEPVLHTAPRQVKKVGSEWEGKGAGDSCRWRARVSIATSRQSIMSK